MLNRFRALHVLHPAVQGLRPTNQEHARHAMLRVQNKQDQDLLQTSNGVGVIVSRQMLSLMHNKNFTRAPRAAAFLGLIPIQSLNPFSKCSIHSMSYQNMFGALYRHRCGRDMRHLGTFILSKIVESQTIPEWFSVHIKEILSIVFTCPIVVLIMSQT